MEALSKKVSESLTEQIQILMPEHINGYKRLFGGKLMEWIDVVAAVVARRHCGHNVTTASIDKLVFNAPAFVNDTILIRGKVTYVGRTSMEIKVLTYVESLSGKHTLINTACIVMVAIDDDNLPIEVPRLICETEEEIRDFEEGRQRAEMRKQAKRQ